MDLGVKHWAGLVEVEGGVQVKHEGVDVAGEALAEFVELEWMS